MLPNYIPHPPNSAWLPPIDPNDEETLEQEQLLIEEQFKNLLSQEMTMMMGTVQLVEEEEDQEEEDDVDDMDEYTDQINIATEAQI